MKRFFVKGILFLIFCLTGQVVVGLCFQHQHTFHEVQLLDQLLTDNTEILYFGDSVIGRFSPQDKNKSSIGEFLSEELPNHTVGVIWHRAYQMDLYYEYCRYLAKGNHQPEIVIIPINLRSFSPEWDRRPQYQFNLEKRVLRQKRDVLYRIFYKPLYIFDKASVITEAEFLSTSVFDGKRKRGYVKDFVNEEDNTYTQDKMRKKAILRYMYSLTSNHRKVKSMLKIVDIMEETGTNVLFYITPINYRICMRFVGERALVQFKANTKLIESLLASRDTEVLNLAFSLERDAFSWPMYPDEHLNERGRQYVAHQLAFKIKELSRIKE